jgi:hypothetical protein
MYTPAVTIVAAWMSAETGVGPRHGVGEPDVQRDLRALAHRAEEEAERDQRQERRESSGLGGGGPEHAVVVEGAKLESEAEHAEQEAPVPDPVDDERLLSGRGGDRLLVVVADEEVGAQPDALPPDEHEQKVLREDEHEHREHEEVEVGEEARVSGVGLVVVHVSRGIDVDQESDERDERGHQGGEGIEPEGDVRREVARVDPARDRFRPTGA